MRKYSIAVVGVTGVVGQEMLACLEERNFPVGDFRPLASARSKGKEVTFKGQTYTIEEARPEAFEGVDIAFFSAGASVSLELAHEAVKRGALVIDNSSAFRMDEDVPLVVPEVNPEAVAEHKGIIANPNCSTTIMVVALKPIHDKAKINRVVVSTYQAVSGAGVNAMIELEEQCKAYVEGKPIVAQYIPTAKSKKHYQMAFNLVPQIDVFVEDAYTKEEMKMVYETRKILGEPDLRITATTIRVPIFRSHSESINIETEEKVTRAEAIEIFANAPGVEVLDDVENQIYPMPLDASGKDPVYIGRIREDNSTDAGLNLWVVGDQIKKGAALNAVQIAEVVVAKGLL
jgi:aspartate-semialdehyde dehydrogenase